MVKKRLLMIDDAPIFRMLGRSFLSKRSYEIHTAESAEDGVLKALEVKPDIVILDFSLKDAKGDEICRRLKNNPRTKHIPVVMVSNKFDEDIRKKCAEAGCDELLGKPFNRDTFIRTIEEQLKKNRRKHPRVPTFLTCKLHRDGDPINAVIRNLSLEGSFIEMDEPASPDSVLGVDFDLPEGKTGVRLLGSVRWSREIESNGGTGVGVEFIAPGIMEKMLLLNYLTTLPFG